MPIYTYRCQSCDHIMEVMQKVADPRIETCEVCGGPVKKVFQPTGIVFKGSGFYVTDHGKRGSASLPASGQSSSEQTGGSSESGGGTSTSTNGVSPSSADKKPEASTDKKSD